MSFNPFGKPVDELEARDLEKLIELQVAEGYFVECKSTFPDPIKTARAIASLANTYGGWYFVGVEADKNKGNIITRVAGFDKTEHRDPVAKVRTAVTANVSPTPVFNTRELTLSTGRTVVAVFVPSDQDTPFITKDGRIYHRVGDSTEPPHANDRHTLDRLLDGRARQRERRESFCRDERTFSQTEHAGWAMVFLVPYPGETKYRMPLSESSSLSKLLDLSRKPLQIRLSGYAEPMATLNVPFNAAHTTSRSVILRQVQPDEMPFNGTTAELFLDGRARFYVPLPRLAPDVATETAKCRSSICHQVLEDKWRNDRSMLDCTHPFDIGSLLLVLAWFCSFYPEWYGEFPLGSEVLWALKFKNTWRWWPFFDGDEWGQHVSSFGLPVIRHDTHRMPEERMCRVESTEIGSLWTGVCLGTCLALGLPGDLVVPAMASMYGKLRDSAA